MRRLMSSSSFTRLTTTSDHDAFAHGRGKTDCGAQVTMKAPISGNRWRELARVSAKNTIQPSANGRLTAEFVEIEDCDPNFLA